VPGSAAPSEFVIASIQEQGENGFLEYAELHAPYREGWEQHANILSREDVIGISAWSIDGVYADPCRWETSLVPLSLSPISDSWMKDFVKTVVQQPGRDASIDVSAAIWGFGGWSLPYKINLLVPADLDIRTCDQGIYNAWTDISDPNPPSGNANHEPGQTDIVYAVAIDRSPVIVHAWLRAGATPSDRAELEAMLAQTKLELLFCPEIVNVSCEKGGPVDGGPALGRRRPPQLPALTVH
jgi:hypothetical protein